MGSLKPDGRLYVMGDAEQQLYEREGFSLPDAVHIQCMDNFRSPRQVVRTINALGLTAQAIEPRSAYVGDVPGFHVYGDGQGEHLQVLNRCLTQLWSEGYSPEQVAVLSYNGVKNAKVLTQIELAGQATHRYSGQYDKAGNPNWSEGSLLVDSLYRFKGQSMPAVVLCEVDFETLSTKDRRKLFVGLTRAQLRVEVVLSARAAGVVQALL
jgi:UvrD-like helicase C-terminal domain